MTAAGVVGLVPGMLRSRFRQLCYRAGMRLITLSGEHGARAWADQVQRAERAERDYRASMDALHLERRRANQLFTACTLSLNLLVDGQAEKAMSQLRVAVIGGRRKPSL